MEQERFVSLLWFGIDDGTLLVFWYGCCIVQTTLLGMLAGIDKSGHREGTVAASSKNIAFVSQIPHLAQTETVQEVLSLSLHIHVPICIMYLCAPLPCLCGPLFQILSFSCNVTLDPARVPSRETEADSVHPLDRQAMIRQRIDTVLDTLNLKRVQHRQIRYLSGGELKRVSIAMQLCQSPDILVNWTLTLAVK